MTVIHVGIANGSASATEVLSRAVESISGFAVKWTARDSIEAARRASSDPVAAVFVAVDLPGEALAALVKRLLETPSGAVLLVRRDSRERTNETYDAMSAGALDVAEMPSLGAAAALEGMGPLVRKLEYAARVGVRNRRMREPAGASVLASTPVASATPPRGPVTNPTQTRRHPSLLAIGASTGGPNAVVRVLSSLPKPFHAAIVVIQHVDEAFAPTMASWLAQASGLRVSVAREDDRPCVGEVLLAGKGDHLRLAAGGTVGYVAEPRDYPYRPSVDVFFESVAAHHRGVAVGVILTGMGRDGAKGLLAMRNAGHRTLAQDERSSVIYGMPKAAAEAGAAMEILDLERIAEAIERGLAARVRTRHS